MSRDSRYIITRSNYTVKEKHKDLDNAVIYERDYMTTTNLGGWDSGSIPYGESNFKMVQSDINNSKKKLKSGKWLSRDGCSYVLSEDTCAVWTLDDLSEEEIPVNEGKVVIKLNKNSLRDYVYYGNCSELIKSSITRIIDKFPGELYVSNEPMSILDTKISEYITLGGAIMTNPTVIENPFNIDIVSTVVNYNDNYNELRFFANSYKKYNVIDNSGNTYCISDWVVNSKKKKCYNNGDIVSTIDIYYFNSDIDSGETKNITIYNYYISTGNVLITDGTKYNKYRIRPNDTTVNEIFNNDFTVFDNFLLDRNSTPIYSILIDTPSENDRGIITSRQRYTFPTKYSWNLDLESIDYKNYVKSLLEVAEFYDEHNYSDNIWKNLTHDSIKNTDITFSNPSKDEDVSDYRFGITRLQSILNVYGRQFDDIRMYINNIKSTNTITYNGNNNLPDYFLSDTNQLSGWEITNVVNGLDKTITTDALYDGDTKTYGVNDLNTIFLKNLKINSNNIFQHKGTRYGIEMILSMFGLCSYEFGKNYYESLPNNSKLKKKRNGKVLSWNQLTDSGKSEFYDYKLDEYVVVAKNSSGDVVSVENELPVEYYTTLRNDYTLDYGDPGIYGIPCKLVTIYGEDVSGNSLDKKYIIPWFNKNEDLDGLPYFQMYGGWMKDENGEYEETSQYMNYVSIISDLNHLTRDKISNESIVYVNNIDNYGDYYSGYTPGVSDKPSNYFIILDVDYNYQFGDNGWVNIPEKDLLNGGCGYGIKALHMINIINENNGNNPHVGYGKYDDGSEYLKYFKELFYGTIKDDKFSDEAYICSGGTLDSGITQVGFNLTENIVDNVKCWYFTDTLNDNSNKLYRLNKLYVDATDDYGDTFNVEHGYEISDITLNANVGKKAVETKEVFFESDFEAWNLETQKSGDYDEAAANSIINVKKMTLEFNKLKYGENTEFINYFHKSIMPYMKQMIPSTTIFEIINISPDEYGVCQNTPVIVGVS